MENGNRATTESATKVCIIWKSRRHKIYTDFSFASLNMKYWLLLSATKFMKLAMLLCPHKVTLMFCPQTLNPLNDAFWWKSIAKMLLLQFTALGDASNTLCWKLSAANFDFRKLNWKWSKLLLKFMNYDIYINVLQCYNAVLFISTLTVVNGY